MFVALSNNQAYWLCQIFGWGTFVVYELVNYVGLGLFSIENALLVSLAAPLGIGFTHAYRAVLLRWKILEMPFVKMTLLAFVGVFGLSVLLFVGLILVSAGIQGGKINWAEFTPNYAFMSVLNWSRYVFVWVLIYHLYGLMERINRTRLDRLSFENQLKNVELQNLKAQLNPHFLFNALNSVKALTYSDPRRAGDAVTLLSDLLRYSLNYEKQVVVPLSDEIAVVHDYLALEKIRFNQRLEYTVSINAAAQQWPIPPILLVTLAENAIKHGIAQLVEGGRVTVCAEVENNMLILKVQNTGQFAPDLSRNGIGLANIKRRLEMLYGEKAGFEIVNTDTQTVTATVQIPVL
ncbi:MAG TPA: histidine kinase [Saprospiraceae bacterium]|nr:histidine kinase [Saprospiraceae bacterium]